MKLHGYQQSLHHIGTDSSYDQIHMSMTTINKSNSMTAHCNAWCSVDIVYRAYDKHNNDR